MLKKRGNRYMSLEDRRALARDVADLAARSLRSNRAEGIRRMEAYLPPDGSADGEVELARGFDGSVVKVFAYPDSTIFTKYGENKRDWVPGEGRYGTYLVAKDPERAYRTMLAAGYERE